MARVDVRRGTAKAPKSKMEAKREEKMRKGLKRKKEERKLAKQEKGTGKGKGNKRRKGEDRGLMGKGANPEEEESDVEVTHEDEEFFKNTGQLSMFSANDYAIKKVKDIKQEKRAQRKLKENLQKRKNIYDSDYEESEEEQEEQVSLSEGEEVESEEEEGEQEVYERKQRVWNSKGKEEEEEVTSLPVKSADGKVKFVAKKVEKKKEEVKNQDPEAADGQVVDEGPDTDSSEGEEDGEGMSKEEFEGSSKMAVEKPVYSPSTPVQSEGLSYQLLARERQLHIHKSKEKLAEIAEMILENPQENYNQLKQFRKLILSPDEDVSVVKLGMATMLAVVKDILPDYRIRVTTEKEGVKVSKEVKALREFEEGLLKQYQLYLTAMGNCIETFRNFVKAMTKRKKKNRKHEETEDQVAEYKYLRTISFVATKCLCELLVTRPEFNYRLNIITTLVPLMNMESEPKLCEAACEAMASLFQADTLGKATTEAVTLMSRTIKALNYKANPAMVETFNRIHFRADILRDMKEYNPINNARSRPQEHLSKKKRKIRKDEKELERELAEAAAQHSQKERKKNMTDTVKMVFLTYFRILKNANISRLLPTVLKGLSRNAHLINIDFFSDLMEVLKKLIVNDSLGRLSSLNCIATAFGVVSGQGESLNIEMNDFYSGFYRTLKLMTNPTMEELGLLSRCFSMMLRNRKMFSSERIAAFIKRICQASMMMEPNGVLCLLAVVWKMVKGCPKAGILFDNDTNGFGVYRPDLDDPEIANALNSTIWELNILRKHYHPMVRDCVRYILKHVDTDDMRPSEAVHGDFILSRTSPEELLREFDSSKGGFKPSITVPGTHPLERALDKMKKQSNKKNVRHVFLPSRAQIDDVSGVLEAAPYDASDLGYENRGFKVEEIEEAGCGEFFSKLNEERVKENLSFEISKAKFLLESYRKYKKGMGKKQQTMRWRK
eukprot:Nk52_evm3s388 gene=Nk52_evmTU3s388